jgi:hypothetical protein
MTARQVRQEPQTAGAGGKPFKRAWQPLTPGGVAALGQAPWLRLLAVELVVAVLASACVVWFLTTGWFPVITEAIGRLPDRGEIRRGRLDWPGGAPTKLAEQPFLAVRVIPNGAGPSGQTTDLQWVFRGTAVSFCSVFGCLTIRYPAGLTVPFNRVALEPWWGAWHPAVLAGLAVALVLGLLVLWSAIGLCYAAPVAGWVVLWGRELTWAGCWRLGCGALLPGALLLSAAIVAYGLQQLSLISLIGFAALHLVLGWIYLVAAPLRLPRRPAATRARPNPFANP